MNKKYDELVDQMRSEITDCVLEMGGVDEDEVKPLMDELIKLNADFFKKVVFDIYPDFEPTANQIVLGIDEAITK